MACSNISIPNLQDEDIINVVKEVSGISLKSADIKNPNPEMMKAVCCSFVCNVLNISMEQITLVPIHVMEVANPDLNIDEAIGPLLFGRALEYVLINACGVNDFTHGDIASPTRKRAKKILSGLTNFMTFKYQQENYRAELFSCVESLHNGIKVYANKRDKLIERISQLKAERLEKHRAVQEMNLSALKARQKEIEELWEQKEILKDQGASGVEELQNLLTATRSSRLLEQAKGALDENITNAQRLMVKQKLCAEFKDITFYTLKAVKNVDQYSKKFLKLSSEFEMLRDSTNDAMNHYKDISSEVENKKKLTKNKMETIKRRDIKTERNKEESRQIELTFEKKKSDILNKLEAFNVNLEAVRLELKKVTEQEFLLKQDHGRAMKALQQQFNSLKNKASMYYREVEENCYNVGIQ